MSKQTRGPLHAVPCPHCRKAQDFRPLKADGIMRGAPAIVDGNTYDCDECGRRARVARVEVVEMIWLAPV